MAEYPACSLVSHWVLGRLTRCGLKERRLDPAIKKAAKTPSEMEGEKKREQESKSLLNGLSNFEN